MAKVRRNTPCPCGSGQKAKRCCYSSESHRVTATIPAEMCAEVLEDLAGVTKVEMYALFDQLVYLPELDLSLQVPLPPLSTPHIERAVNALQDDDPDAFDEGLLHVVASVDTPEARRTLAKAVIAQRDEGTIAPELAALAVFELDRETSSFFISAVAESIAVLAGDRRTPSGLLIAS